MRWKRDVELEIVNLNSVAMFSCLPIPYYIFDFRGKIMHKNHIL